MANNKASSEEKYFSKHLLLVLCLLFALLVTITFIFTLTKTEANIKDYLSLTFTTFGAWIGAGAAYFFGRENLKTATDSILKAGGLSTQDKLEQTQLRELNPHPIPGKFKRADSAWDVKQWIYDDPDRYFVVVVNDKGQVDSVLHEEGIMRFFLDKQEDKQKKEGKIYTQDELKQFTLDDVFKYISDKVSELKAQGSMKAANAFQGLANCAIVLKDSDLAKTAKEMMDQKHLLVTLVKDAGSMPVGYITNTDIEKLVFS